MVDFENPVAGIDEMTDMPADDAQAAGITAEELLQELAGASEDETAVQNGDGGHEDAADAGENSGKNAKFDARIKAALTSQRKKYEGDVSFAGRMRGIADGLTDEEIIEALTEHQARKMHEQDAEISEKAAKQIIRSRQNGDHARNKQLDEYRRGVESLMQDGWEAEELRAFAADETVRQELADGKTLRQAATAFLRRARAADEGNHVKKRGVPTVTKAASGTVGRDRIAEMSDEEFRKFQKSVTARALSGEKIRL